MRIYPAVHALQNDITTSDPLCAGESLRSLPLFNQNRAVHEITAALANLVPDHNVISQWDYTSVVAAMRDMGLFLGSLKRHGIEPEEALPQLTPVLQTLGAMSDLPPRDTVLHYILWNCKGKALRTYTPYPEESILIESTRSAYIALDQAALELQLLLEIPITDPQFGPRCRSVTSSMGELGKSICQVYQDVGAAFFVHEIRPYFEPILVDGVEHRGPGAVELPLFIIDHLLWSSNTQDDAYVSFKETYLTTVLPDVRSLYHAHKDKPSLVDTVVEKLRAPQPVGHRNQIHHSATVNQNVDELKRLFGQLISFRAPHLRLAQQAYELTPDAQFDHGSGGYTPEIVRHVLNLTRDAREKLSTAQQQYIATQQ